MRIERANRLSYHRVHRRSALRAWFTADVICDRLLQALCDIQHTVGDWVESLLLFDADGRRGIFLQKALIGQWDHYSWYVVTCNITRALIGRRCMHHSETNKCHKGIKEIIRCFSV